MNTTNALPCVAALATMDWLFALLLSNESLPTAAGNPVIDAITAGGGNHAVVVANLHRQYGQSAGDQPARLIDRLVEQLREVPYLTRHGNVFTAIERALDGCARKLEAGDRPGALMCASQALVNLGHVAGVSLNEFARQYDPAIPPA